MKRYLDKFHSRVYTKYTGRKNSMLEMYSRPSASQEADIKARNFDVQMLDPQQVTGKL